MMLNLKVSKITINTQQICYLKWIDNKSVDITFSNGKTLSFEGKDFSFLLDFFKD